MIKVRSGSGRWDGFAGRIHSFLKADTTDLIIDGKKVHGYRSPDNPALWIRDHSDILRGARYFDPDMKSAVSCFAEAQANNGRIFDYVTDQPVPGIRENWETWVRIPVEADVEFRFVKAAYLAWQATGDDEWIQDLLPNLDRALTYTRTHQDRWDEGHGLVKRPYTIDTWDFDYTAGRFPWLNFKITDDTFWGLFHGDNSGFYESARLLGSLYARFGESERSAYWKTQAENVRERANRILFNGQFYTHFYKLIPVEIDGVDEATQLSFSNPMAINRGMSTHEMAVSILNEYQDRKKKSTAFAEWFSIDPPFPDGIFGDEKLIGGAYINGGIFPLCGGELARAAFEHGFESYGVSILKHYHDLIQSTGSTYLWYFPDGTPSSMDTSTSPEATATDGWGSSAMLYGFVEGLCGIVDRAHSFRMVRCSPRWIAAGEVFADVSVGYEATSAGFGYAFHHDPDRHHIRLKVKGEARVDLHLLMPDRKQAVSVKSAGRSMEYRNVHIKESNYVDVWLDVHEEAEVLVRYG